MGDKLYGIHLQLLRLNIKQMPICKLCNIKLDNSNINYDPNYNPIINPKYLYLNPRSEWVKHKSPIHQNDKIISRAPWVISIIKII